MSNKEILINSLQAFVVVLVFLSCSPKTDRIGVFYDKSIPQIEFAVSDISAALELHGHSVELKTLSKLSEGYGNKKIIIALKSNQSVIDQLVREGGETIKLNVLGDQAYALRTTKDKQQTYWAIGGDIAGAMYAGLQIAENISFNAFGKELNEDQSPYIKRRGIKFNLPLDQRAPTFNHNGDQGKRNIKDIWDFDFWTEYLDELARNRYNTLSYWTKHPFTSMVKLEEYHDVEINDVIDGYGNLVKKMTIDEKIEFWQKVMAHADNRSIDIFYITWNIYLNQAAGKYGITDESTNEKTIAYLRESVKQFLLTYPNVDGIGVTAGEHMPNMSFEDREKWLWSTYALGMMDAKKEQPDREITFIHRHWFSSVTDIMSYFKDYNGPFEFSFKYVKAHLYSSPDVKFEDFLLDELPDGTNTWWNLRNDDIFYLRWGDPEYTRDFIMGLDKQKTAGYLMGSDGYVWGRVYNSTDPTINGQLENKKHWYNFMLWGRLGYNPNMSEAALKSILKFRFAEADVDNLFEAWKTASKVIPQTTQFFWRNWDYQWYPEGCKGKKFVTVKEFINGETMEGSGILNITEYSKKVVENEPIDAITPLQIAERLADYARRTLELTKGMGNYNSTELNQTVNDINAFAHLGNYYSEKINGAVDLSLYTLTSDTLLQNSSMEHLEKALQHWKKYAEILTKQYLPRRLDRTSQFDWNKLTEEVELDIELARTIENYQLVLFFEGIKDGNQYPAGSDLSVNIRIEATFDISFVSIKVNGENLNNDTTLPYLWDAEEYAVLRDMTPGGYEFRISATDVEGNKVEKTINITIEEN